MVIGFIIIHHYNLNSNIYAPVSIFGSMALSFLINALLSKKVFEFYLLKSNDKMEFFELCVRSGMMMTSTAIGIMTKNGIPFKSTARERTAPLKKLPSINYGTLNLSTNHLTIREKVYPWRKLRNSE